MDMDDPLGAHELGPFRTPMLTMMVVNIRTALGDQIDCGQVATGALFQLDVARAIAAQFVIAVQYIHSQKLVHGDLHRGNILLRLSREFDDLSTEELYEQYGEPIREPVNRSNGQKLPAGIPQYGIFPVWLGKQVENIALPEARIILSDFGEAFCPAQEKKFESRTPLLIRPPDAWFEPTKPPDFSSDIWTLARTIFDIVAQRPAN
ncbi:uncharacterized protein P174DRAFT_431781 [Aspergillus novofumigatus IBT 16806]|uniref:Protein kinase domain-containing protein n=1 Tax=Aspergillus novofumigatus (strain IBT 16806) TaxID=1392255 RepID=A0A2I1C3Z7_ASPN1|nr:uncharacterized protein P174DRAFT_431781 [Aspergillus novofumigatus IBT 16806]PKX92357.1 hypothetical protein P174DRAFT_431781 [Aspergillus novofumigatus IBT 16806]